MFIKYIEWLEKQNNLKVTHRGVVKDNEDPKKLGRIKVIIKGLLEGMSNDSLPWIYPENSYGQGGRVDLSGFSVPEVDSEVVVIFPFDDIYTGFYTGYWQSEKTHQTLFDEDYPDSYGQIDSTVSWWRVNKTEKYVEYYHNSETTIRIDKDGNMYIYNPGNVDWEIKKSLHLKIGEDFIIDTIRDRIEKVSGDCIRQVVGNVIEDLQTDFIRKIAGNLIENVTTDVLRTIGEDIVESVGRDFLVKCDRDYLVEVARNLLMEVGIHLIQNVGEDVALRSGKSVGWVVDDSVSIEAMTMIALNAASIMQNAGVSLGGIVMEKIPSKIADKQDQFSTEMDNFDTGMTTHDTSMGVHTTKEQTLVDRIDALETKVQELTDIADEIKSEADSIKSEFARIT